MDAGSERPSPLTNFNNQGCSNIFTSFKQLPIAVNLLPEIQMSAVLQTCHPTHNILGVDWFFNLQPLVHHHAPAENNKGNIPTTTTTMVWFCSVIKFCSVGAVIQIISFTATFPPVFSLSPPPPLLWVEVGLRSFHPLTIICIWSS